MTYIIALNNLEISSGQLTVDDRSDVNWINHRFPFMDGGINDTIYDNHFHIIDGGKSGFTEGRDDVLNGRYCLVGGFDGGCFDGFCCRGASDGDVVGSLEIIFAHANAVGVDINGIDSDITGI